jgi:hypothetical protein
MIEQWMSQVMQADRSVGSESGTLIIRIQDASIIEEKLPPPPGLSGLFTVDQSEAYHGHILLQLLVKFPDYEGEVSIESRASQSVDENTSLRERQIVWISLGNKMIRDIDRQLRETLPRGNSYRLSFLGNFLLQDGAGYDTTGWFRV